MDHNVSAWDRYISSEEEANEYACVSTAVRNGHTPEEAELCDDGDVGCPDCPFLRNLFCKTCGNLHKETHGDGECCENCVPF